MYHGKQPYIVMNTNENTMMMAAYPPTSHPQNFSLAKNYQNQVVSTMPFNTMSANVTQTPEEASQGSTSATYSNQEPPTSLSRKGGSC